MVFRFSMKKTSILGYHYFWKHPHSNRKIHHFDGIFNGCWNGSPKRWDRWRSPSPNWQYIPLLYHLYIAFWGVICYRSHLLGEPETTIDIYQERWWIFHGYGSWSRRVHPFWPLLQCCLRGGDWETVPQKKNRLRGGLKQQVGELVTSVGVAEKMKPDV